MSYTIEWSFPEANTCVKRLVGESLFLKVGVRFIDETLPPESFIVEAWSDLLDGHHHFHAIQLKFLQQEGDCSVYETKITPINTGFFNLQVRVRRPNHNEWTWFMHEGVKKTLRVVVDPQWVEELIVYNAFVRFFGVKESRKRWHY